MKGIGDLMKQAQAMQEGMQENMRKMQEDLQNMDVVGVIAAAINDAARRVESLNAEKMAEATSGLNLPPGMKLPF